MLGLVNACSVPRWFKPFLMVGKTRWNFSKAIWWVVRWAYIQCFSQKWAWWGWNMSVLGYEGSVVAMAWMRNYRMAAAPYTLCNFACMTYIQSHKYLLDWSKAIPSLIAHTCPCMHCILHLFGRDDAIILIEGNSKVFCSLGHSANWSQRCRSQWAPITQSALYYIIL